MRAIHLFWWCLYKGGSYSKLWGGTRIPFQVYTAWKRPHCHAPHYRPHWSGPNGSIFNNKNLPIDFKHMSPCTGILSRECCLISISQAPNMSQMILKWPQWHQPVPKDLDRRKLQVGFALLFGAAQHAPLQNVLPRKYMMQLNDVQTLKTWNGGLSLDSLLKKNQKA